MSLTKAALQGLNTTNFPNNTTGYITPELLRDFNSQSIDSMALQTEVDTLSASFQSQINGLEDFSSSLVTNFVTSAELNASSSTLQSEINGLAGTGSVNTLSQSVYLGFSNQSTFNSNTIIRFNEDELAFNQFTQSTNIALSGKASLSQDNYFVGNQYVNGKITITGNIYAANLTGSTLDTSSLVTTSSFNAFTQSYVNFSGSEYKADSSSFDSRINSFVSASIPAGTVSSSAQITALGFATTSSVNSLSASIYSTDSTQSNNITTNTNNISALSSSNAFNHSRFATTGSNTFNGSQNIVGDITASGNLFVSGTINAYKLNVTIESSSVIFSSGSNILGDEATDTQTLNGQVNVVNSLTASGLKYPTADNGVKSFIQTDGAGILSLQYVDTIWESVRAGENVPKGTPLYISGSQGAAPIVYAADASNPSKMPVMFIAGQTYTAGTTYPAIVLGLIEGMDLTGYTAGQTVYVAEGGGWTSNLPSGSNSVTQVLGVVTKGGNGGKGLVLNPGPAQLPTLQTGYLWVGNGNNRPVSVATSSLVTNINTGSLVTTSSFNAFTQSTNDFTASISTSVGLLQTFSGSEYKGDSASFDSRINASGGQPQIQDEGTILGNATSFNFIGAGVTTTVTSGTASVTIPGGGGTIDTGSFATTGSNLFIGDQIISGNVELPDNYNFTIRNGGVANLQNTWVKALITTSSITVKAGGVIATGSLLTSNDVVAQQRVIATGDISSSANVLGLNITTIENSVAAFNSFTTSVNTYTQSANNQFISLNNISASYLAFTQSYFTDSSSFDNRLDIVETTFATTGSNTFKGQQTLSDNDLLNQITVGQYSSSLVLFGKGFTSSSLTNITSNTTGVGNIIFKTNNNTATTIVSGSNNLFVNPAAPTAGFTRYIGGDGNVALFANNVPQISSSMAFPIAMSNNILNGNGSTITLRGPISASTWNINSNIVNGIINVGATAGNNARGITTVLNMFSNTVGGTFNINANQTANVFDTNNSISANNILGGVTLNLSSSAITFINNIINDGAFIATNQFYSSSVGKGFIGISRNNVGGQANTLIVSGTIPAGATASPPTISDNAILGGSNILYSNVSEAEVSGGTVYHSGIRNLIAGNNLIVSASSTQANTNSFGSAFVGRYNAIDGNKAKTAQTVFAVGTGTSTNRKTGFLIDSGSNTFVEGTLNVSGSSSFTGSVNISTTLTLGSSDPLPTGVVGMIATSASVTNAGANDLFFYDGLAWKTITVA